MVSDRQAAGRSGAREDAVIVCGDARQVLAGVDAASVHACITSPPYWGLRDYSDAVECVFGGDEGCEHEWGMERTRWANAQGGPGYKQDTNPGSQFTDYKDRSTESQFCSLCGAWRGQFGLEPTPEMYVEHALEFLRAIRRVLRKDGTCWLNLGDSYAGSPRGNIGAVAPFDGGEIRANKPFDSSRCDSLKPKDLCMIPFRVALAAQADGWWVRSVIIWNKPNPMPESVRDRPTTSHEYILLLTKSGDKQYWTHPTKVGSRTQPEADYRWRHKETGEEVAEQPCESWKDDWTRRNLWQGHDYFYDADAIREKHQPDGRKQTKAPIGPGSHESYQGAHLHERWPNTGRNKRTVWTIATQPYPEAHFATFPEALVEPMILTTPTKCCAECGAGWERVVEVTGGAIGQAWCDHVDDLIVGNRAINEAKGGHGYTRNTLGFRPTCSCEAETKPAIILDPFAGRGTVARVARKHNRDYVMIEMNPDYIPMMKRYLAMADEEVENEGETWVQPRMDLTSLQK